MRLIIKRYIGTSNTLLQVRICKTPHT